MSTGGFVRAGVIRNLGPFLAKYPGVSAERLFAAAGIDAALLADPEALLSLQACMEMIEEAARLTGDTALGIRFASGVAWSELGVLGYVILHSPTLGAAFTNACRYFGIQRSAGGTRLDVQRGVARVTYQPPDPASARLTQDSEMVLSAFVRLAREGTGRADWAPREVHLRHRAPATTAPQERYFGAPVHFGRRADAIVFPADDLRLPLVTADANLLPILLRHADACLARLPASDDFRNQVRRAVIAALGNGQVAVEAIALQLGMSARSLQRRLQADGQSFKALVDETRLELSRTYLADPALSLTEAAFLLGYADLSAFSRAFRRWTGRTALDFRRAQTQR